MEIFNHKNLKYKNAQLHGELFSNSHLNIPLTLLWKISIQLDNFKIGNFTIYDPVIELGSFTLPYNSITSNFDNSISTLKSWKQLPNSTFSFSKSFIDNIGSIYYNIKNKELGNNWNTNPIYSENTETFDNVIDIERIEFGEITENKISCKLSIKIGFDGFNMQEPPFSEDYNCEIFDIEVELEIKEIKFNGDTNLIADKSEVLKISEKVLHINDYEMTIENRKVFINLTEHKKTIEYIFIPKF